MNKRPNPFGGITEIAKAVTDGQFSPIQVVSDFLERIQQIDPILNSYITVSDTALQEASKASEGKHMGPLHGVPISVKDIILSQNIPTTAGSKVFGKGLAGGDAPVLKRLREAGAILVGKNNLHEFAFGVTNENAHFGAALNPWSLDKVPGGSSGGSAAAVAAGLCCGSIGTDTRGSIRIPSACCGVTGLKPTRDLISTRGVIPLSWTLDHVGPISKSVRDTATLLQVMVGAQDQSYLINLEKPVEDLCIGVCDYYFKNLDPEIESIVRGAIETFEQAGVQIRDIAINYLEESLEASDIISRAEAVTYHDRCLRKHPNDYGTNLRERLETGYSVTGIEYVQAQQIRRHMVQEFRRVFTKVDCLIGAVLPAFPPTVGENFVDIKGQKEPVVQSFVRLNAPQNMGGVPPLTLPAGFSQSGLPVGFQLIGGHHEESLLFQLGACFQRVSDWHLRNPVLSE